jgi:thiol-disulfide isomerase/thioredoxin
MSQRSTKRALAAAWALALAAAGPAWGGSLAMAPGQAVPKLFGWRPSAEWIELDWKANRATLVNFWATWCQPCRVEMPALQKLSDERGADGLQVVGVIWEETSIENTLAYLEHFGVSYTILKPHRQAAAGFGGVASLPTSLLIDGEGKLVRRYVGAQTEQVAGLVKDVQDFLDGRPLDPLVIPQATNATTAEEEQRRQIELQRQQRQSEPE